MSQLNPVVWFEIYVSDMERAMTFYSKVLGVEFSDMPMPPAEDGAPAMEMKFFPGEMNGPGASGALVKMEGVQVGGGSTMVYFGSEDCAVEEARVVEAGGEIFQAKMDIGDYGFATLAKDTEGNMFGIHSMK